MRTHIVCLNKHFQKKKKRAKQGSTECWAGRGTRTSESQSSNFLCHTFFLFNNDFINSLRFPYNEFWSYPPSFFHSSQIAPYSLLLTHAWSLSPTSTHWRLCGVWLTLWGSQHKWELPFPHQALITCRSPQLGVGLCAHFPLHAGSGSGLGLQGPRACCGNFREFTLSALHLLANSCHEVIHLQLLRPFQCPLLHRPRAVEQGVQYASFMAEHSRVSHPPRLTSWQSLRQLSRILQEESFSDES